MPANVSCYLLLIYKMFRCFGTTVKTPSNCFCVSYLIFDLHCTVLYCCLKETLGSSCWQQKRKLAVLVLTETARRPCAPQKDYRKHKQPSSAPHFPPKSVHGEKILLTNTGLSKFRHLLSIQSSAAELCAAGIGWRPVLEGTAAGQSDTEE